MHDDASCLANTTTSNFTELGRIGCSTATHGLSVVGLAVLFVGVIAAPCLAEPSTTTHPLECAGAHSEGTSCPKASDMPSRSQSDLPRLRMEMFVPGTGAQADLRNEVRTYFRQSGAMKEIAELYGRATTEERWELLRLAGLGGTPEAVEFLSRQARLFRPQDGSSKQASGAATSEATHSHSCGEADTTDVTRDLRNAMTAANGVVDAAIRKTPGAANAVTAILTEAHPAVAQALGVELFSRGLLTADHRRALERRNIKTAFRRLSDAERERLFNPNIGPGGRDAASTPAGVVESVPPPAQERGTNGKGVAPVNGAPAAPASN